MTKPDHKWERAESLLENWPAPERDEAAWEKSAQDIEARLTSMDQPADDVLAPPLPRTESDGDELNGKPAAPERPKPSLAELARKTVAAKEAQKRSLDASTLAALSARGAALSSPPAARRAPVPPPDSAQKPAAAKPLSHEPQRGGQRWGLTIAAFGVAAALVLVLQGRGTDRSEPADPKASTGLSETPARQSPDQASAKESIVAERVEAAKPADPAAESKLPSDPSEPAESSDSNAATAERPSARKPGAVASKSTTKEPASKKGSAAEDSEPTVSPPDRDGSRPSPGMSPASGVLAETTPLKPSAGAAQAALGSVMMSARTCVAGQTESSRASVTFGSDGSVKQVEVSGAAAGTPAERCVRTALSRARVQPFTAPTFTVGTTIRPL